MDDCNCNWVYLVFQLAGGTQNLGNLKCGKQLSKRIFLDLPHSSSLTPKATCWPCGFANGKSATVTFWHQTWCKYKMASPLRTLSMCTFQQKDKPSCSGSQRDARSYPKVRSDFRHRLRPCLQHLAWERIPGRKWMKIGTIRQEILSPTWHSFTPKNDDWGMRKAALFCKLRVNKS